MSSNLEQPEAVDQEEGTTPQPQEQKEPELASKVASSGPIPLPKLEALVEVQGEPGRARIGRPVELPVSGLFLFVSSYSPRLAFPEM